MRTRTYKCYYCKGTIEIDEELVEETYGKKTVQIKRIHKKCYDFKEREKVELDSLVKTIREIYNIEIIPSSFYTRLQDIRNGNDIANPIKRSKKGYRYKLIEYTYRKNIGNIEKTLPRLKGGVDSQLAYGLAIVRNNINDVVIELRMKRKRRKEIEEAKAKTEAVTTDAKEVRIVKKNNNKELPKWL